MDKIICNYPWTHFEVNNPNGDVTMCCDSPIVLGNVNRQSILEIWNGEGYRKVRKRMLSHGAHSLCTSECAVLKGFKSYQSLDWFREIEKTSPLYMNAERNEKEIGGREIVLQSRPRWMRFAYSYVCNLNCYHCYQEKTRKLNTYLPDSFIEEVYSLSELYQVIFYYGGEPFLYEPTKNLMKSARINPYCRLFFVTNATLLNDEIFDTLRQKEIGLISVSLDATNEKTYSVLRKGGNWLKVQNSLEKISQLRKTKKFVFTIALTVNTINALELERFCDLGIALGAEPMIALVNNPYGTISFQKTYLQFSDSMVDKILEQIDRSLEKLRQKGYDDAQIIWKQTRQRILNHKKNDNNPMKYIVRKTMHDFICGSSSPVGKLVRVMRNKITEKL